VEASTESPSTTGRRVAVFGGSFNPPHVGHVLGVVYALSTAPIDEVLVVPVYQHPFAKHLASFADRLEMCRLAVGWLPRVVVSTVEEELGGESRTLRTLEHLRAAHPSLSLRLLVGADVLGDLPKWHRWERIAELAPPLVLGRRGVQPSDVPVTWVGGVGGAVAEEPPAPVLPRVSSTEIRAALAAGDVDALRGLVPASVIDHIVARGLYGVSR
jgi:nicotinate-nucleotide adenylyltransferase